jgi:hypothetical protein
MFTYPTLLISYVYTVLYLAYAIRPSLIHISLCTYYFSFLYICVFKVVVVKLLGLWLDITAWSELEAQAFRYTPINIC